MEINPGEIRAMVHIATGRTGAPIHDEDLEQDVALHALEASRRIGHIAHPRAFLMKIVFDTVRDHWRRKRQCEDLANIDERFISQLPTLEKDIDVSRQIELLRSALQRIPDRKRMLLELFYVRDHSISEIAQLQRRSISAVKMELLRSRESLGRILRSQSTKKSR